jgi:hypothetical protein
MVRANTYPVTRLARMAFAAALAAAVLPAATLELLSLPEMIVKSTSIVRARVTGSYAALSGAVIYTHYRIQASETFKGRAPVEFVVPGGVASHVRQSFAGAPQFQTGDECVFFLWTGKSGQAQIIGLTQGLFALARDGGADPIATRRASREVMLQRGSGQQVKDQTLVMKLSELRARIAGGGK